MGYILPIATFVMMTMMMLVGRLLSFPVGEVGEASEGVPSCRAFDVFLAAISHLDVLSIFGKYLSGLLSLSSVLMAP